MSALHIFGMHGLGDNLHQRAVIRELLKEHDDIWLETPWPCMYGDLPVKCIGKTSRLRTQAKNAEREADRFHSGAPPASARVLRVSYPPEFVRSTGSVLAAMSRVCGVPVGDFRLSVPDEWLSKADEVIATIRPGRPLMLFRPLMDRSEWGGCLARNPDTAAYRDLYESIRDDFCVVSIADLEDGKEWEVARIPADVEFHRGELDVETIAGLICRSALVFSSPGFAIPLAQAVGTPSVCVFGGYENGSSFLAGAQYTPHLPIEPIRPCQCFSHTHACDKRIDMPLALSRLSAFVGEVVHADA